MGRNRPDVRRGERLSWQSTFPDAFFSGCGSETVSRRARGRKTEARRRNNQLTLRANDERVIVRDRRARGRHRAPAGLPMVQVTTLGSCGGRMWSAAAATATERRLEAAACLAAREF